jgi:alpha-1,2-mannosyltransferase
MSKQSDVHSDLSRSSGLKSLYKGAWPLRWNADHRKTIYLFEFVIAVSFFILCVYVLRLWHGYEAQIPRKINYNDFFGLWSYAKIASTHSAADLYHLVTIRLRQVALGMSPDSQFLPFFYPPTALVVLWPLSLFPLALGYFIWMVGTLVLFVWAVVETCTRHLLCIIGIVLAPVCTINIAFGQSGFLSAALILAGVRFAGSRPILSGILIGLLSYKPQLGLLVPIALASAGFWTAFAAACATVIAMAIGTTVAFGWAVWPAWAATLSTTSGTLNELNRPMIKFMPTIFDNLQMAGLPLNLALGVQVIVAIIVAFLISSCFRQNPGRLATAALLVGTFLATPHAFVYDMPMVAAAMALFIEQRLQTSSTFSTVEVIILLIALMFPVIYLIEPLHFNLPISGVALLVLFGLILRTELASAVE